MSHKSHYAMQAICKSVDLRRLLNAAKCNAKAKSQKERVEASAFNLDYNNQETQKNTAPSSSAENSMQAA